MGVFKKLVFIKVFVTKSSHFRAKIKEFGRPSYEVTIGGKEWGKGKGKIHEARIYEKSKLKINLLMQQLQNFNQIN